MRLACVVLLTNVNFLIDGGRDLLTYDDKSVCSQYYLFVFLNPLPATKFLSTQAYCSQKKTYASNALFSLLSLPDVISETATTTTQKDEPYTRFQSQGQGHRKEHEHII